MSGIDELISKSLTKVIKKNLDSNTEKKIKMKLFKKYGLSIHQAIKDFSKVDEALREFLKSDISSFEQKCLTEVITIKILKDSVMITIKEKNLVHLILEILGDNEYRRIIESTIKKPLLISEIINISQLPKTSGYRKISFLIRNGFLMAVKKELTVKRRSIEKFTTIFDKISFEVNKNQSVVEFELPLKTIEQSSSIRIITSNYGKILNSVVTN